MLEVHVTTNWLSAAPLASPAVHATDTVPVVPVVEPEVAMTAVGAVGAPTVMGADAMDCVPVPAALVAETLKT